MAIDAKWLDILKASGWQTAAIAAAGAVLLYANAKRLLPVPLERWMIQTAVATTIVCVCLTISSIVSATMRATQRQRARLWSGLVEQRRLRREVAAYIPSMTPREREIIAYLLAHNQRIFTNTPDGATRTRSFREGSLSLRSGQGRHSPITRCRSKCLATFGACWRSIGQSFRIRRRLPVRRHLTLGGSIGCPARIRVAEGGTGAHGGLMGAPDSPAADRW